MKKQSDSIRPPSNRWLIHILGVLISLGLFITALVVIHVKLKQYHLHDIIDELNSVRPTTLLLGVFLVVLNYLALSLYDILGLHFIRHRLPFRRIMMGSFVGYVFSNNTTIVGGSAARYRIYSSMDMSASEVGRLVLFCVGTFWLGFIGLSATVFLSIPSNLPKGVPVPFGSVRFLGMTFITLMAFYFILIVLYKRPIRLFKWEISLPSFRMTVAQIAVSSTDWLLTATILYILLPSGMSIGYAHCLMLFILAQFVGLVSTVPGGLGIFESMILLLMNGQAEPDALMGSLLLFRLLYYILPLAVGTVLLGIHEILPRLATIKRMGISVGRWGASFVPTLFAFTTLLAGAVLLFSGALPSVEGRMAWLRHSLPLPAVELSHFLGSVIGAALLILSRGLQRRLDAAYHMTIWLLFLGIIVSLVKGLDYEEAIILSLMLLALLPCGKEFYRKASLLSGTMTYSWIAWVTMVMAATVWLGMLSYKHVEYSGALWWRFAFDSDAPRFLRATTGAVGILLCFALAKLLRPKAPSVLGTSEHLSIVQPLVQASPRTYARLALLGDKRFLLNEQRDTFIMYAIEGRSWIALGDPIGPQEKWEELLWEYRELCDRYDGRPIFYQVSPDHLDYYIQIGMSFFKLGEEARVDLPSFHLEGNDRKDLRHARNKLEKSGYHFEILPNPQASELMARLKTISDAWLNEKHTREKGFSQGFFNPRYISQCPIAIVRQGEDIRAFANLWQGADYEEMSVDLMRYVPGSPSEIMDYLFVELLLWGQAQGYRWFNFGMAPLSGLEDHDLAPFWSQVGAFVFRVGEHFYNFQGLRAYKEKFGPVWRPKYLACSRGLALPGILTHLAALTSGGLRGTVMK